MIIFVEYLTGLVILTIYQLFRDGHFISGEIQRTRSLSNLITYYYTSVYTFLKLF